MEHHRPLSPKQARILTDRIVATPKERWTRIAEGHARGVAKALGYASWAAYCEAEFGAERFRIPRRHRIQVLTELKDAGMSFEDVEVAVIPRTGNHVLPPPVVAALPLPGGWDPPGRRPESGDHDGRARIEDQLGFSPAELDLIGALIEVDDDEFRRVLTAGHRRGDLSVDFIRDQCQVAVRTRDSLERSLDRALRAVERAREMVDRGSEVPVEASAAVIDMLKLLEDESWDLVDTVDRLHARLDNRRARGGDGPS